ncbi:hypothetical protein [Actinomadura litoris]|uniref:hypothetical protein n=1 Tax=Actinomadura litoris TaxID=2678616 RepID=UPI001FA7FE0D|nr:hypothetical protein [Actinomadura litoris]
MRSALPLTLSYDDLDRLAPEVLPGRLALSTGGVRGDGGSGDTTVVYACQATSSPGTTGLLGTGLFAQAPYSTLTCVPATVVHHHS